MKRVILAAVTLISVAFVGTANAQSTGNVTVNINLKPIHTLLVTAGQETVNLTYTTTSDYNTGVTSIQNNHLTIFSTGGFVINVRAGSDFEADDEETIEAGSVTVAATKGTNNTLTLSSNPVVSLSAGLEGNTLISSAAGGRDQQFNVTYKGAGNDAYINKYDKDRGSAAQNVYTATVTYTILAD